MPNCIQCGINVYQFETAVEDIDVHFILEVDPSNYGFMIEHVCFNKATQKYNTTPKEILGI